MDNLLKMRAILCVLLFFRSSEENLLLAVSSCRMSNYILAEDVIKNTSRYDLAVALMKHKNVLFEDNFSLYQKAKWTAYGDLVTGMDKNVPHLRNLWKTTEQHRTDENIYNGQGSNSNSIIRPEAVSFSDFTETILLTTEIPALIEGISDVFIHALCVERSLNLELILHLFLNFIATHISQKGYQTSQIVLLNILQVRKPLPVNISTFYSKYINVIVLGLLL